MVEKVVGATGFLIDGFPLDLEEANAFDRQIVPVTRLVQNITAFICTIIYWKIII